MLERKHLACAALFLGLLTTLAANAGADSIRLVSRIEGAPSVTGDSSSWTRGASDFPLWDDPPVGSRLSADGRYVVFLSGARNLIPGLTDGNSTAEIYLHDRTAGTTVLVSRSAASPTTATNSESREPSISADGRYVVFLSRGTDLVAGQSDTNNADDLFLFDRVDGSCLLVSHAAGSATTAGDHGSSAPFLSADGSRIAFASDADDLVFGQAASSAQQIFVFDRPFGGMTLVSHAEGASTQPGNGASRAPSLSADGTLLAYTSAATDLAQGVTDNNGASDVFLYNWFSSRSALVSRSGASSTTAGSAGSAGGFVSADGSHVVFVSKASDLLVGQSGQTDANVFLYRRSDAAMTLVSRSMAGAQQAGDGPSLRPAVSQDGSSIAFLSWAEDLVSAPSLGAPRVFLFQRSDGSLIQVSDPQPMDDLIARQGHDPRISADGSRVAFANSDILSGGGVPLLMRTISLYDRGSGTRTLVSASPSGVGESMAPEMSADGQVVAYTSTLSDLVEWDFNRAVDVFAYERTAGVTSAVSRAAVPPATAPWQILSPALSEDGNLAVFLSAAPNLAPGQVDTNGQNDVFVWSRQAGAPRLVSRAAGTASTAAAGSSRNPALSADGDWIAFETTADNLVPGQTGAAGSFKLVLVEQLTGKPALVSHVAGSPTVATPGGLLDSPVLSRDGRFMAFLGVYSHLLAGQTASSFQVFLYDRVADSTVLVSHQSGDPVKSSSTSSIDVDLSADGRFVVFASQAVDLGPSDSNGAADVFLYDRDTGERRLLSRKAGFPGVTANGNSDAVAISSDGRWVLFASGATDLVPGQVAAGRDLFLYDVAQDTVTLVSHAVGQPVRASGGVTSFDLSADGRFLVFAGWDGTGHHPAFLHDRTVGEREMVSQAAGSPGTPANGSVDEVWISADSRFVAFTSTGNDLVPGVTDGSFTTDIFLFERETGALELVSRSDASPLVAGGGTVRGLSADGGQVLIESIGPLTPEDNNGNLADLYLYENLLPGQDFYSVTFCRALDTRQPADGPALVSGMRELFTVPGACGVPDTAKAVVLNVTVAQATGAGYLKLHPGNAGSPASSVNFAAGQVRSNNLVVRLSTDGDGTMAITPLLAGGGTVHVILDVMGYFE